MVVSMNKKVIYTTKANSLTGSIGNKHGDVLVGDKAFEFYNSLKDKYEVLFDNRNLSAGAQFADADLLGIPIRIVLSKRNVENNKVEVVTRHNGESKIMSYDEVYNFIENFYNDLNLIIEIF